MFSDEGKGNFTLSLNMFPDKRFVSPYTKDDFPVAVVLRKLLFFEVSVTSGDKQLSIIADRCYATPTQDQQNSLNYEFITKGYEQSLLFFLGIFLLLKMWFNIRRWCCVATNLRFYIFQMPNRQHCEVTCCTFSQCTAV